MKRRPPRSTLFPSTTLFRSTPHEAGHLRLSSDTRHKIPSPTQNRLHEPLPDLPRDRSEEHTPELQSQSNLGCRLLLEKKINSHINFNLTIPLQHLNGLETLFIFF